MREWLILEIIYRIVLLMCIVYLVLMTDLLLAHIERHQKTLREIESTLDDSQYVLFNIQEEFEEFDLECVFD